MKKDTMVFAIITFLMTTIMYCTAFHQERDKCKMLEKRILKLEQENK